MEKIIRTMVDMDTARALADHLVGAGIITEKQRGEWIRQLSGGAEEDPGRVVSPSEIRRKIAEYYARLQQLVNIPIQESGPERRAIQQRIAQLRRLLPQEEPSTDNPETLPSGERENLDPTSGGSGAKKSTAKKATNVPAKKTSSLLEELRATLAKSKETTAAFEKMMAQYAKPEIPTDLPERPRGPGSDSPRVREGIAVPKLGLDGIEEEDQGKGKKKGGSDALDTLETVTSLGQNVPGIVGRISRIANVGAQIGNTAEKERKLMELQNELKRRIEAQQVERQAINRKYAPSTKQQVRNQFNFFRFMEDPSKYKQRQKFLRSQGRETDVMEAPVLSPEQARDLDALAQKYQIPQLQTEIQSLQEELAANPISTDGISGVVSSVIGNGKNNSYLMTARKYAKAAGYDPKCLTVSTDKKYKLEYKTPDGKIVRFGSSGNKDYILYQQENPVVAETRRKAYLKRSAGIKGNWAANRFSANNLARRILWGGSDEDPTLPTTTAPSVRIPESDPVSPYTGPKPASPKPIMLTKPKKSKDPKPLSGGRCRFCHCAGCASNCMDDA